MKQTDFHHPVIEQTSDGSSTLVHPILNELYHSRHGAWTESHHIFIGYGLMPLVEKESSCIRVFEMGFGSGLNATLTREVADHYRVPVLYTTVELYPVKEEVITGMVMPQQTSTERNHWLELHNIPWGVEAVVSKYFTIHKIKAAFPELSISDEGSYDLIFYDAFAPAAQPELWNVYAMDKCYKLLSPGGKWLSYCAKGQVRRNLRDAGFAVEALPGPPGKREITMALK